jgi:Fe2+ or Zn2+ uptake regulation protein
MPKRTVTASEFIIDTLAADPSLEWSVRDLMDKAGERWSEANVYNTLTRLHAAGKLKRTKDGRAVWWSIADGLEPALLEKPVEPEVDSGAKTLETASESGTQTATGFIIDLLTRHPDYEMSVSDIWEEAERKWKKQSVANALDRLAEQRKVLRVKEGAHVWFSIAVG